MVRATANPISNPIFCEGSPGNGRWLGHAKATASLANSPSRDLDGRISGGSGNQAAAQGSGARLHSVAMTEIRHLAKAYLVDHPELIEEAKVICAQLYQEHLVNLAWQRQRRAIQKRLSEAQSKSTTTPMVANATARPGGSAQPKTDA
jgi:hypothetical protein